MLRLIHWATKALQFANRDFCPQLNRYVYWLKQPIGWVVAATAFSFLIGLFVGAQGYVLAFAFLALLTLGLVWPWLSMKGVRCSLIMPIGQIKENETTNLVFKVRNFWPIPVFGMIVEGDFLQDINAKEEPIAFSLKRIPAFSETEFPIAVTPLRRGLLPSGDVKIRNGFPFGLADVSKVVEQVNRVLVWPQCESLEGSPGAKGNEFSLLGAMSDRSGNEGDVIGVRSYRRGDQLKNIHWAQTARSQRLMVRERQTPSSTSATILLDLTPDHHQGEGIHSSFEWAIRIAASICHQLHQTRSRVRVVCLGLAVDQRQSASNQHGIDVLMNFLACLPTLKAQQAMEPTAQVRIPKGIYGQSKQTFFVCTSLSADDATGQNVQSVLIELKGFETPEEPAKRARTTSVPRRRETMVVTAPTLVSEQLSYAWARSFERAG